MSALDQFIRSHKSDNPMYSFHVCIQNKLLVSIDRKELDSFWDIYCDHIKLNKHASVAEKTSNMIPIIVDVDLNKTIKQENDDDDDEIDVKLYTNEQLETVIQVYQTVLKTIVKDCEDEMLMCVVLEKPGYIAEKNNVKKFKNGFHLHFPKCFMKKIDYENHLLPRVVISLKEKKLFSELTNTTIDKIIDKGIISAPWLIYGSVKEYNMKPYKVSRIVDHNLDELTLTEAFSTYKIYDFKEKEIEFEGDDEKETENNIIINLPRILSIQSYGRTEYDVEIKPRTDIIKQAKRQYQSDNKIHTSEDITKNMELANKLVPLLSDKRAMDRNEWMEIGWLLYNISAGTDDGLQLWCEFSSRCDSYDEDVCINSWRRMTRKKFNIRSLRYYAKIDNPVEYMKIVNSDIETSVIGSLDGSHTDIALLLHKIYGDEFVCAHVGSKSWFQFTGHRWEQVDDGLTLRMKISNGKDENSIIQKYNQFIKKIYDQIATCESSEERKILEDKKKKIDKIIHSLKTVPFKNNIMREASDIFFDKTFRDKLNTNPYLIGYKNGIYDLKNNVFRDGKPEDFISVCMPICYREYEMDDEQMFEVHDFLEKVFPDPEVRRYFLDTASDLYVGGNQKKLVLFYIGKGNNAKTKTQVIIEKMLGPLAIKFNTTLLTGKKTESGAANAELARSGNGVRWAVLEEPDGDEEINIGMLKILSGNDSMFVRDLFEKGKETKELIPLFKLVFICNKLPKLKFSDKASWNRIRVIPFEATFSMDAPEDPEEQKRTNTFPIDVDFDRKIPHMLEPFNYYLLHHRKNIKVRIEPEKVKQATTKYREQNDSYQQFINERIEETKDSQHTLSSKDLYSAYKAWFKFTNPNAKLPSKVTIEEYFSDIFGPLKKMRWIGYQLKTEETGDPSK